jgi:hypothetical protein
VALLRANGAPVIRGLVRLPEAGAWVADLTVASEAALSGPVALTLNEGATILHGALVRGGVFQDTAYARVVAGAGGFGVPARPQAYGAVSLGLVLGDLLRGAGETLSPTADQGVLGRRVAGWTTPQRPTGQVIARLLAVAAPDAAARFLLDGSYWVGVETFPAAPTDGTLLSAQPFRGHFELGVEVPNVLPGTTLLDQHVTEVEWRFLPEGARMGVWFQ